MFEIRDNLMISIILNSSGLFLNHLNNSKSMILHLKNLQPIMSKNQSETLLKTISAFSFETVASKPKFRESCCIESIALFMLKSNIVRDRFRVIIKDEIMQYE